MAKQDITRNLTHRDESAADASLLETGLTRRTAIRSALLLLGGATLIGCRRESQEAQVEAAVEKAAGALPDGPIGDFSLQDIAYLDEIAETIVPATATPGAKAAKVGAFLAVMATDVYDPAERKTFLDGMRRIDEAAKKATGVAFMQATPQQRLDVLSAFDRQIHREAYEERSAQRAKDGKPPLPPYTSTEEGKAVAAAAAETEANAPVEPATFFAMMKELTFLGYFTSEIGCTQALRYTEVPGRYDPCVPYVAGTPAWAAHA